MQFIAQNSTCLPTALKINSKVIKKPNSPIFLLDIISLSLITALQPQWTSYGLLFKCCPLLCPRAFVHIVSFARKDLPPDILKAQSFTFFMPPFKCPIHSEEFPDNPL